MLLWRDYLHNVEKEIGKAGFVSWRNKTNGWHDSWNMNVDPVESNDIDWHNSYNINILGKNTSTNPDGRAEIYSINFS